jgi:hypothetical protein
MGTRDEVANSPGWGDGPVELGTSRSTPQADSVVGESETEPVDNGGIQITLANNTRDVGIGDCSS